MVATLAVIAALLGIGLLFNILAVVGLLRFPDVYTRLHASTKCTTFGMIFIVAAAMVYGFMMHSDAASGGQFAWHALFALGAVMLTNPTGAHAISRAAHKSGVKPAQAVVDRLEAK